MPTFHKSLIRVLWWEDTDHEWILNTDGTTKDNKAGGGGVLRKKNIHHLPNIFNYFGEGTSNMAESRALLYGLNMCKENEIFNNLLKYDSKLVINWLLKISRIPFQLSRWWRKIFSTLEDFKWTVTHVFREGNQVADSLSKMALEFNS